MRVLVVCDWFLKYAASQSAALRRAGMEVFLLCRDHASEFGGSSEERQYVLRNVADGVALGVLPGRVSSPSAVRDVGRLRGLIRSWRPDVVHAHDNTDPRLLAIVGGLTRVTTVHDPVPHPGQPPLPRVEELVRRRWIRGSAAVVVHGTENAEALPAWAGRKHVAVIPHGAAVRDRPLPVPDRPSVLLFGRLEPYKGVDVLLGAMERVWAERADVRLIVAGRGPEAGLVPVHPLIELRDQYVPEVELDTLFGEATVAVLPYVEASYTRRRDDCSRSRRSDHRLPRRRAQRHRPRPELPGAAPGMTDALSRAILRHLDHGDDLRRPVLAFARERVLVGCMCATGDRALRIAPRR